MDSDESEPGGRAELRAAILRVLEATAESLLELYGGSAVSLRLRFLRCRPPNLDFLNRRFYHPKIKLGSFWRSGFRPSWRRCYRRTTSFWKLFTSSAAVGAYAGSGAFGAGGRRLFRKRVREGSQFFFSNFYSKELKSLHHLNHWISQFFAWQRTNLFISHIDCS
mgnify:CR=1 FL=1